MNHCYILQILIPTATSAWFTPDLPDICPCPECKRAIKGQISHPSLSRLLFQDAEICPCCSVLGRLSHKAQSTLTHRAGLDRDQHTQSLLLYRQIYRRWQGSLPLPLQRTSSSSSKGHAHPLPPLRYPITSLSGQPGRRQYCA